MGYHRYNPGAIFTVPSWLQDYSNEAFGTKIATNF
jgi:hypothetical protein